MSLFRARAQRMLVRFRHFGTRVARFFHGTPPTAPPAGLVEQEEEAAIVAAEGEEKVGIGGSIADHDKGHGEKLGGRGDEDRHSIKSADYDGENAEIRVAQIGTRRNRDSFMWGHEY